jgi:AraC-like DNA-binding protein
VHVETIVPQSAALRNHVEFFYLLTHEEDDFDYDYQVFPHTLTFVSAYADARAFVDSSGRTVFEPSTKENTIAYLDASYMTPLTFLYRGKHTELTIGFKPQAINTFLPKPVSAYLNDSARAAFAPYRDFLSTMKRALALVRRKPAEAVALLETYLCGKLHAGAPSWLGGAVKDLTATGEEDVPLHGLAQKFRVSPQNLSQQFKKYVGKSPADFRKTVRFRRAMTLGSSNEHTLTTLAHRLGYYDQSHMTKDFRSLTGRAPKDFFSNLTAAQGMDVITENIG